MIMSIPDDKFGNGSDVAIQKYVLITKTILNALAVLGYINKRKSI